MKRGLAPDSNVELFLALIVPFLTNKEACHVVDNKDKSVEETDVIYSGDTDDDELLMPRYVLSNVNGRTGASAGGEASKNKDASIEDG